MREQPKTMLDLVRAHIHDASGDDPVVQELVELVTESPQAVQGVADFIIELVKNGQGFSQYFSTGPYDCVGEDEIAKSVREIAAVVGAEYNTNLIEQLKYYRHRFRIESQRCTEYFKENYKLRGRIELLKRKPYTEKLERALMNVAGATTIENALAWASNYEGEGGAQ